MVQQINIGCLGFCHLSEKVKSIRFKTKVKDWSFSRASYLNALHNFYLKLVVQINFDFSLMFGLKPSLQLNATN